MKIIFYVTIVLTVLFGISAQTTYATVGGPTVVYDLKYDTKTNSIYYTEQSDSGKGCPPELKAISLATNATKVIYGCDDETPDSQYGSQTFTERIRSFTEKFTPLQTVYLKNNKINVSVDVVNVEKIEDSWVIRTHFIARVSQGTLNKANIPFAGCSEGQPLVVDGYRIPGVEDKLVLLFSRKSDCSEGGYIGESVYVVSGVNLLNEEGPYAYKMQSPLIPHEGSLVVYAKKYPVDNSTFPQQYSAQDKYLLPLLIVSAVFIFLLGIWIGRMGKKGI
ncbi:MAG: hypothetical protein HZA80_01030 [Candidatus Taylorbacteria bacterium]|nr:hypothetical protein [Candidatus Taylorbacteria bacterium]